MYSKYKQWEDNCKHIILHVSGRPRQFNQRWLYVGKSTSKQWRGSDVDYAVDNVATRFRRWIYNGFDVVCPLGYSISPDPLPVLKGPTFNGEGKRRDRKRRRIRGEEGYGRDPPPFRWFPDPPLLPDRRVAVDAAGDSLKIHCATACQLTVPILLKWRTSVWKLTFDYIKIIYQLLCTVASFYPAMIGYFWFVAVIKHSLY